MITVTATNARSNFSKLLDQVAKSNVPIKKHCIYIVFQA